MTSANSARKSGAASHFRYFCLSTLVSSARTFRSMITKTNSTMIAPAYTMICIAAMNCALSVRKSAARLHSTTINRIALYMGLRCRITLNAATTASAARPRKRMWENSITDSQEQDSDRRSQDDVEQRRRQQNLPPEIHQLVVTEPRQRPAQPDVQKQEEEDFGQEPEDAEPGNLLDKWPVPPAQKQRRRQH